MRTRRAWSVVAFAVLAAACGCAATSARGFSGYPGPMWEDAEGSPLSADAISVHHGDKHCDHDQYDFLHMGWPLGSAAERAGAGARQYVRDLDGGLSEEIALYGDGLQVEWARLDALPKDAVRTGFTTTGPGGKQVELLLSDERDDVIYMMIGDAVERWPLADPPVGCD